MMILFLDACFFWESILARRSQKAGFAELGSLGCAQTAGECGFCTGAAQPRSPWLNPQTTQILHGAGGPAAPAGERGFCMGDAADREGQGVLDHGSGRVAEVCWRTRRARMAVKSVSASTLLPQYRAMSLLTRERLLV